jgi:hypothetical protein
MANTSIRKTILTIKRTKKSQKEMATRAGFEPARAKPNGTCIHRLNHSAIVSTVSGIVSFLSHICSNFLCGIFGVRVVTTIKVEKYVEYILIVLMHNERNNCILKFIMFVSRS